MYTTYVVRGFVCILARPPPTNQENGLGEPIRYASDLWGFPTHVQAWRNWHTREIWNLVWDAPSEGLHPIASSNLVARTNFIVSRLAGGPSKLRLGGGVRRSPTLHQRAINPLAISDLALPLTPPVAIPVLCRLAFFRLYACVQPRKNPRPSGVGRATLGSKMNELSAYCRKVVNRQKLHDRA